MTAVALGAAAITAYEQDIAICAELADHYGARRDAGKPRAVHAELDQSEPARRAWAEAIELYTTVGTEDDADRVRQWLADLDPKRGRWWRSWT